MLFVAKKRQLIVLVIGIICMLAAIFAWLHPPGPPKPSPPPRYAVIREWKVRFQLPGTLTDIQYMVADDIGFTSSRLTRIDPQCAPTAVPFQYPLGVLQRSPTVLSDRQLSYAAHFGEYYYYFTPPQAHCFLSPGTDSAAHQQLLTAQLADMSDALRTLEPAP